MVEYQFYTNTYHGNSVPEDEWQQQEARAEDQLKEYKRKYTVTAPDADSEAMAICAMAEAMYGFDLIQNGQGGPVASASIGSVSVSYGNAAASSIDVSAKGQEKALLRCARRYMEIYRGCC